MPPPPPPCCSSPAGWPCTNRGPGWRCCRPCPMPGWASRSRPTTCPRRTGASRSRCAGTANVRPSCGSSRRTTTAEVATGRRGRVRSVHHHRTGTRPVVVVDRAAGRGPARVTGPGPGPAAGRGSPESDVTDPGDAAAAADLDRNPRPPARCWTPARRAGEARSHERAGCDRRGRGRRDAPIDPVGRALRPLLGLDESRYDLDEVARRSGIDAEQLRDYWRALGFPDPRPGDRVFGDADVEMLTSVVGLMVEGVVEPDVARQMARVIGASLDRIAAAQIDASVRRAGEMRGRSRRRSAGSGERRAHPAGARTGVAAAARRRGAAPDGALRHRGRGARLRGVRRPRGLHRADPAARHDRRSPRSSVASRPSPTTWWAPRVAGS